MPPNRAFNQNGTGEFPAMQLLLEQIIANQDKQEAKLERVQADVGDIKETLRDGSGQFEAVKNWQKGHEVYHREKDEAAKEGPHWLVKAGGTGAAGAFAIALMWFLLRGAVESNAGTVHIQRTESVTKESK